MAVVERFEDLDLSRRYSYGDYALWRFRERVELFRGWVMRMAGPTTYHQRVSGRLFRQLSDAVEVHGCEVFAAPTDVVIARSEEGDTVVQPDLLVVCDPAKIKEQYIDGPPDFIAEIVSPGNSAKELDRKYKHYEEAGVREYWVVHPLEKTILRFVRDDAGVFVGLAPRTVNSEEVALTFIAGAVRGTGVFP